MNREYYWNDDFKIDGGELYMNGYALVTGGTSGIGLELALNFARDGINLCLVSRSEEKLKEVAKKIALEYDVEVFSVPMDLSDDDAPFRLYDLLKEKGIQVDYLVNNAGVGNFGRLKDTDMKVEENLVKLNILALLRLTKLFIPQMVERRYGYVLNVSSMAAFLPGPVMANYYASKAYVLSLSEALHEELKGTGVKVSVLCPGPVKTGFQAAAGISKHEGTKIFMKEAKKVADIGYVAMWKGKPVAIPGMVSKLLPRVYALIPRSCLRKAVMAMQKE